MHFVATHKVVVGIALGVLSVATGGAGLVLAGALEASTVTALGMAAVASGTGAELLDVNACAHHSLQACGGAVLGGIGLVAGGGALPFVGLSAAAQYRLAALSFNAGIITTTYDVTLAVVHATLTTKTVTKKKAK